MAKRYVHVNRITLDHLHNAGQNVLLALNVHLKRLVSILDVQILALTRVASVRFVTPKIIILFVLVHPVLLEIHSHNAREYLMIQAQQSDHHLVYHHHADQIQNVS
jgi:hypothetical protein